jgi:hypothetical protein
MARNVAQQVASWCVTLSLAACSAPSAGAGTGGGSMTATVNGQTWSAGISSGSGTFPGVSAETLPDSEVAGTQLVITGTRTDGATGTGISISFVSTSSFPVGSYTVVDSNQDADGDAFAQVTWTGDEQFDASSGTLTLASISATSATGTFEFTGTSSGGNSLQVSDGHFQTTYVSSP